MEDIVQEYLPMTKTENFLKVSQINSSHRQYSEENERKPQKHSLEENDLQYFENV